MLINLKLNKNFTTAFNRLSNEYGTDIVELNGFSEEQLSWTDFLDNFVSKETVADATIDGNANIGTKDICSLEAEMSKPHSKLIAFNKIYQELNQEFGFKVANDWIQNEWDGHFYLHDAASSTYKPYCYAYDLERLVNEGLYFIDTFNNQPPKHLVTYTDFVGEFVSWASNRTSGACGLPSFLIYSFYFWRKDIENNYFVSSPEAYRDQEFQRIIYKLNQPYLRVNQSAFTNFSIFDRSYLESIFGGKEFPDGTFIIDYIDDILEYQKSFMEVCSKIRSDNMMTFPVLTFSLLRTKEGKFVDEDFAKWCCRHNMKWADSNFFISDDITSLSNCCRLLSDVKELGYFNSIGGTSLEVGSIKVNTINLARLSYENKKADYLDALKEKVYLCLQTLHIIRNIISKNVQRGLLPNYSHKLINMDSQYSTIGIIGIYETLQKYRMVKKDELGYTYYTDSGIEFAKSIFNAINEVKQKFIEENDVTYSINIEQIPGERAASILMQKDKFFFPKEKYELPLYGNQWIPLGIKTSLDEKIKLSAILDKACNGGSIAHINIESPFNNFETAWKMLNKVADSGVVYFAFCTRISACKHNHGFYGDVCPVCGEPVETTYQRIVGFLTPCKTYSKERKEEFKLRDWFDVN
jgi:ribonucleoside-triphosphate reductase